MKTESIIIICILILVGAVYLTVTDIEKTKIQNENTADHLSQAEKGGYCEVGCFNMFTIFYPNRTLFNYTEKTQLDSCAFICANDTLNLWNKNTKAYQNLTGDYSNGTN